MKKFFLIIFLFIFVSSASAAVYKWVDEKGVTNFSDDYSKIPSDYHQRVEEISIAKTGLFLPTSSSSGTITGGTQSAMPATQAPPISQTLIREGDFAIKLVGSLKIGQAKSEADAEAILASFGIAPKNGWIADYPVTPDVIGELENAIVEAADSGRLPMGRNEAVGIFRTAAMELGLPIVAETRDRYAESPSPVTPQYTEPSVINNYYYTEGPPIVTYYPPPPDYYYLYAWIPSPFWYSGFFFPGFYILYDFHTVIIINKRVCVVTNHFRDPNTGRVFAIDPAKRYNGRMFEGREVTPKRGFNSPEIKNSARSIYDRSRERLALGNTIPPKRDGAFNNRNPVYTTSNRNPEKQVYNRESRPSGFNSRNRDYVRPSVADPRMDRSPGETGPYRTNERVFSRPDSFNRQKGMEFQRPPAGEIRSFSPPTQGGIRSFNPPLQGGARQSGSFPTGSMGFSRTPQGGGRSNNLGYGGPRL
ncbi:MAG: DUF4124 domain-containing protein [Syntrophaceae bacterium]|nr:DUF4124 domain-containing protein [Syntrophaceae bacterium]